MSCETKIQEEFLLRLNTDAITTLSRKIYQTVQPKKKAMPIEFFLPQLKSNEVTPFLTMECNE
jgi:hypothetical protein